MIKWSRKTWWIIAGIMATVSFLFQARLFFPHLSLIATPEFELNDAIQLSFASKYWYFMKLHAWQLPFWSTQMGSGFPVLGEGQTGIFYIPNILFYGLLPTPAIAYNLSLVFVTFLTSLGTCVWLAFLGIAPVIAVLGGLTFGTSGFFLFHLQHMTLLQSFSLLPWLFVATHMLMKKQRFQDIILVAVLFSQQIFAGFIQAVFITAIGTSIYACFLWRQTGGKKRPLILYFYAYALGLLLAAPQLIPSIEFYKHVIEQSGGNDFSTKFSFAGKSFLSFLNPFALGNPKYATYYNNIRDTGLLFWETNGYVGIIPLFFCCISFLFRKIRKHITPWVIILGVSILLMLGKYSPFYFIFDFFPFSLFRVPARFIALTSFMIVTIAASASNYVMTRKSRISLYILCLICWTVNLCWLIPNWYTYHAYQSPSQIEQSPEFAPLVAGDIVYRFNTTWNHRTLYRQDGWTKPDDFSIFSNAMRPNTNVFWNITTYDAYPSRTLTRKATIEMIIDADTIIREDQTASMSAVATSMLTLTGSSSIISGNSLDTQGIFSLTKKISDGVTTMYLYQKPSVLPRVHFATTTIPVSTVTDIMNAIKDPVFDPTSTALIENTDMEKQTGSTGSGTLSLQTWTDQHITVETSTEKPTTVLFQTTYYPGWVGTIDDIRTTLYPANISSTALIVPAGNHIIELRYRPLSLAIGMGIAGCTTIILSLFFLFRKRIGLTRELFPE